MSDKTASVNEQETVEYYSDPANHAYFCPTPGKITLLAITSNKMGSLPEDGMAAGVAECGFNAATLWLGDISQSELNVGSALSKALDKCRAEGVASFVNSPTLRNTDARNKLVEYFSDKTNIGGWCLPTADYSELTATGIKTRAYNDIWNLERGCNPDSKHMIIMSARAGEIDALVNYRDYLIRFQNNVGPSVWETAVYPVVMNVDGGIIDARGLFYKDLQIFSLLSIYCCRPFWYTVMCMSYRTNEGIHTPKPTVEEMRFSVFSALAYGAQGLNYWGYRQREDEVVNGQTRVQYFDAPINKDGSKNKEIWDAVRTVNREVAALNDVFFNSCLVDVRHTGVRFDATTSMLTGSFGPLRSIMTEESGVLVSHLNTQGQDYLVVVNHSFRTIDEDYQMITLTFAEDLTIHRIIAGGSFALESAVTPGVHRINLPRGGYLIYRWS